MDSREDRARVRRAISSIIRGLYEPGLTFRLSDLTERVRKEVRGYIAPDSAGRIMRLMKQEGDLNYKLLSRSESLYVWTERRSAQ